MERIRTNGSGERTQPGGTTNLLGHPGGVHFLGGPSRQLVTTAVRQFAGWTFADAGTPLEWRSSGVDEQGFCITT